MTRIRYFLSSSLIIGYVVFMVFSSTIVLLSIMGGCEENKSTLSRKERISDRGGGVHSGSKIQRRIKILDHVEQIKVSPNDKVYTYTDIHVVYQFDDGTVYDKDTFAFSWWRSIPIGEYVWVVPDPGKVWTTPDASYLDGVHAHLGEEYTRNLISTLYPQLLPLYNAKIEHINTYEIAAQFQVVTEQLKRLQDQLDQMELQQASLASNN